MSLIKLFEVQNMGNEVFQNTLFQMPHSKTGMRVTVASGLLLLIMLRSIKIWNLTTSAVSSFVFCPSLICCYKIAICATVACNCSFYPFSEPHDEDRVVCYGNSMYRVLRFHSMNLFVDFANLSLGNFSFDSLQVLKQFIAYFITKKLFLIRH